MEQIRWFAAFRWTAIALVCGTVLAAQTGDPAAIQQRLNSQFKLTTITADRTDIVTPGDVIQLHKPGLVMYGVASPLPPSNSYKNGKIGQGMGGFGKDLMIGMATPGGGTAADYPHRQFVAEEKCWVTGIQVQKDGVLFQLYSDPYDNVRYYASLKIPFPNKKEAPSTDVAMQTVNEVLTIVLADDQGGQGEQSGQSDQGGQSPTPSIFGTYLLKETGARLDLFENGSFTLLAAGGKATPGQFTVNGDTVALTYSATGRTASFKIQGDRLVTDTGLAWIRQAGTPAPVSEAAPAQMPDIAPPPPPADTQSPLARRQIR